MAQCKVRESTRAVPDTNVYQNQNMVLKLSGSVNSDI